MGHDDYILEAVDPDCINSGLTEGTKCTRCQVVTKEQEVIDALGHNEVTLEAVAPTCDTSGITEGAKCTRCGEITKKQEILQPLGHTVVTDEAIEPTCLETGLTEGTHCSVCGTVFKEQEIREKLSHTEVIDPGTDATCTKPGISEGKHCSVCKTVLVEQEPIEALDHDLIQHEAKLPTNYSVGWEAYETCSRCDYTTYVEIPALGEPEISDYATFLENLKILEGYAVDYVRANPGKDPMALLIKYIRTGVDRYNSGSWNIMAGYEDADFAAYVKSREEEYNATITDLSELNIVTGLKNINNFTLPNGDYADIGHMFGTMDISYHNKNSENHADVAGWAGDTVDLLSLSDQFGVTATEIEAMVTEVSQKYFLCDEKDLAEKPSEGTFSLTDVYGDLDGFYVMKELCSQDYENGLLYDVISNYFTVTLSDEQRAAYFLENRLNGVSSRSGIREAVYDAYISNKVVSTLEGTRDFNNSDLTELRRACCYVFADYLCKLAGDYVEIGENNYFEVFSTESSTLAPGITQEIKLATTADNKQIKYYIAIADINSEYVDVYANYKDNDPGAGWGMSRVRDQANAAQEKYGNPESEYYIENYNVIASINGAGYNMTTGEPSGLLVMDGVEYHSVDANGFFGILKDGTAIIGTAAEYNAMKDQVQEAIARFGAILVKDGEIAVTHSDSYTEDRASRTAVGITKTGKVVFMVLDGRQEPVSCGGSMQEIAQIMLEAGCVDAINLDGGGSTTYVAKQEGDDELSLINKPSDGFERSVSTSLMMVSTAPSSTAFHHALLETSTAYLTIGSGVQVTASGVSATGNTAELPDGTTWAVTDTSIASISEDGFVTALQNGTVDVNLMLGSEVIGTKTLYIVIPDTIYFSKSNMDAVYGQTVELPVVALYGNKPVTINENDVVFSLSNEDAGIIEGFTFTGNQESGIKNVKVTAALEKDTTISGSMTIALYNQGEASFDFDRATGGNRQLAWDRQVSNATTEDAITYLVVDPEEDMVTSYIFAIDMTQIPIPEELEDLTYMLPGADVEGASAWTFLMQLAERVSVLTEVTAVVKFNPNFDVVYSGLTLVNEYFTLENAELNEDSNELTISLRWKDQTQAIDPETANPICILSGIKLIPKDDAAWNSKNRLNVVNSGTVGYSIYLRANALYSFAQKEENQEKYKLYPFVNPDDESETGGYFSDTYAEFTDEYTLVNSLKNGWVYEDGGYAYYVDGERYTGIQKVDGYYYDFGEDGINIGQTKYSGLFEENGKAHYAKSGELVIGWVTIGNDSYLFDENGDGCDGKLVVDEVELEFTNGKLVGGYTGFVTKSDGNTYYYVNGQMTYGWYYVGEELYHFNTGTGVMTTGTKVIPDAEAKAKGAYYDFAEDGRTLRGYFNPSGYYYWAGLPKVDAWVKNGADSDPDAWYRTNGNGHFVTDTTNNATVVIAIDGVEYTFDNTNGKLLKGSIVNEDNTLYYYWAGEPVNDGWFEYNGATYYAYEDGHLATGSHVIDGTAYMFTSLGVLVTDGVVMTAVLNDDDTIMSVKVSNTEKVYKMRLAIWSAEAGQDVSLQWHEAKKNENGEWVVSVPMCTYNRAGIYHIHAYATADGQEKLLVATTVDVASIADHTYTDKYDTTCDICGQVTRDVVIRSVPMYRLYDPNSGEHFYTGSTEERDILVEAGWNYEGVGFNFPVVGDPVYRLYDPVTGEHLYTMDQNEINKLLAAGWNNEGVAFNSAASKEIPQYRLHNPNAKRGAYHFTSSEVERDQLIALGWEYQGIGWYSCLK